MYIDLTHRLTNDTHVYPGDPKTDITVADTFEAAGYLGHNIKMGTHAGTHIDAPAHMIEAGKTLDMFDIQDFIGPACYISLPDGSFDLDVIRKANIQPGDVVVFNTQMSYKFYDPAYFTEFPAMNEEVSDYLIEKQVKMIGLDTCSADNTDGFPIHKKLLSQNILIIENLTNVEQLEDRKATIYALPLRFDLDGSPARVIAEVHS